MRNIMKTIRDSISGDELKQMSEKMFNKLVKAVVDIEQGIMVVDADMHVDQEQLLLDQGSQQENLWGINLHPYNTGTERIEFDSMINLRPSWGNKSRSVEDPNIQKKIITLVERLVKW